VEAQYSEKVQAILSKPTASVDEFKIVMGCGRGQAYEFIRQGGIRTLRIGKRILIPTSAIRSMLGEDDAA
jgi:excisionase family DNA binding protein